jgi:hypothetical protein
LDSWTRCLRVLTISKETNGSIFLWLDKIADAGRESHTLQSPPDSFLVLDRQGSQWQILDLHEEGRFDTGFGRLHIDARVRRFQRFDQSSNMVIFC